MQFEYVSPRKGPEEPPHMVFTPDKEPGEQGEPDKEQCFQMLTTAQKREAELAEVRADKAFIPISDDDVAPLQEAKIAKNDAQLLVIIRKYVQTHGLGLRGQEDSLSGTTHAVPDGSYLLKGRVRHYVKDGEFNEIPLPKRKSDQQN